MKKYIKKIIVFTVIFSVVYLSFYPLLPLHAQSAALNRLKNFGRDAGYNTENTDVQKTFVQLLGQIIGVLIGLLGIIFLILIIYSGFNWMTAGGDESKVTKAKETLQRAVIGLIIIAGSFGIWRLVVQPIL